MIPVLVFCMLSQASFEAASVKRLAPGTTGIPSLRGGPGTSAPGQLRGAATMKVLLMRAYDLKDFQVEGPAWLDSERYEINARVPAGADRQAIAGMLRSLLAERFRVAAHREKRKGSILALTVAKHGPKFQQSAGAAADENASPGIVSPRLVKGSDGLPELGPGSELPRTFEIVVSGPDGIVYKIWWRKDTMRRFVDYLSGRLNREVIDLTKLSGPYDFQLAWSVEKAGGEVSRTGPLPDQIESFPTPVLTEIGQSIFSALPAQLGLRLEQRRGTTDVLVVERVEMNPTEN